MAKYLLCRPEAGLNDMLRQLSICVDYCLLHDRILVIDTASTNVFSAPFADYFSLDIDGLTVRLAPEDFLDFAEANQLSIYPPVGKLRHGTERLRYDPELKNTCLGDVLLTFDFTREYAEDILLHHQSGGGPPTDRLMRGMRVSPRLAADFRQRWSALPKPYIGIHIRDTDKKSSFETVQPVLERVSGTVFLATDSAAAQQRAARLRPAGLFMSEIPDCGGAPIHYRSVSPEQKMTNNTTAVVDLLLLAFAEKIYVSTTESGYSRLALRLNRRQSWVLRWFADAGAGRAFRLKLWIHIRRNQCRRLVRSVFGKLAKA